MSKQLESILNKVPHATAKPVDKSQEPISANISTEQKKIPPTVSIKRISAEVPSELKEEIQNYIKKNQGETEKTVLLRALRLMGFDVKPEWLVDNRTTR
jgi:hypothetical protein